MLLLKSRDKNKGLTTEVKQSIYEYLIWRFWQRLIILHFGRLVHLVIFFVIKITPFELTFYEFQVHFLYFESVCIYLIICKMYLYLPEVYEFYTSIVCDIFLLPRAAVELYHGDCSLAHTVTWCSLLVKFVAVLQVYRKTVFLSKCSVYCNCLAIIFASCRP